MHDLLWTLSRHASNCNYLKKSKMQALCREGIQGETYNDTYTDGNGYNSQKHIKILAPASFVDHFEVSATLWNL